MEQAMSRWTISVCCPMTIAELVDTAVSPGGVVGANSGSNPDSETPKTSNQAEHIPAGKHDIG
ncbi:uncharacterized protein An03g04070 [Aspergillus niger]|uniref:Contig An03c0120, genomic contig n=2 Tax=Aspergillus niger TaxID=5061 RepID=A2QGP9_ASPNC|nr:uncharacterized protein An03g04070 [Aspergillus niger]CAK47846.1 unnamed protein product [Aspergillus niger]